MVVGYTHVHELKTAFVLLGKALGTCIQTFIIISYLLVFWDIPMQIIILIYQLIIYC